MAILQISQITQRKGLQIDLPQLAGAEFGWSIDERRLWIGNGSLAEGAPVVGNTEILTEYSNLAPILNYTYSGAGATGLAPVSGAQSIQFQDWLDQFASVLDFGIVGDGVTNCAPAINAALAQLYGQITPVTNPQQTTQRGLFFPAGVYVVDSPINIPSYATFYGDGPENTIIKYTGGTGGFGAQTAAAATSITISNMGFTSEDAGSGAGGTFLVENATNVSFNNVYFSGDTTAADPLVGFSVTGGPVENIVFDNCDFTTASAAVVTDKAITGVNFTNCYFNNLTDGISLGFTAIATGPSGVRITNNLFDGITNSAIVVGNGLDYTSSITTGHNVFLNIGGSPVIAFNDQGAVSIGDMFDAATTVGGSALVLGQYNQQSSLLATLADNQIAPALLFTQDVTNSNAISFSYTIFRGADVRTGTVRISSNSALAVTTSDDYDDTGTTGVTFSASRVLNTLTVNYTTTSTGSTGTIQYSVNYFN